MKNKIIDTDIGTDCDDVFAIAYALKYHPEKIKAITNVHGDTKIRAKIARKIIKLMNKQNQGIKVIAGEKRTLTSPNIPKYWTGIEKKALTLEEITQPLDNPCSLKNLDYTDTDLICLGPLTNIALQLNNNPSIREVPQMYFMGDLESSHNFKADKTAAQKVLQQKWKKYIIRKQDSFKISFTRRELQQFKGTPLGDFLYKSAINWLDYTNKNKQRDRAAMYDVLTVSAGFQEPYVTFNKLNGTYLSNNVNLELKKRILDIVEEK
jgi:purine nucleosidase